RFEVRFVLDGEAIQHSTQLAASLRHRHFPTSRASQSRSSTSQARKFTRKPSIPRTSKRTGGCPASHREQQDADRAARKDQRGGNVQHIYPAGPSHGESVGS